MASHPEVSDIQPHIDAESNQTANQRPLAGITVMDMLDSQPVQCARLTVIV